MNASCLPLTGGTRGTGPCAGTVSGEAASPAREEKRQRKGLSKRQRLTDSAAFKEAFDTGNAFVGKYMVMRQRRGCGAALRLGVVVSKRTLPRAVDRFRAKRLLREAYRLNRFRFKADCDIVLVGRRPLADAGTPAVERDLLRLANKAGLLP